MCSLGSAAKHRTYLQTHACTVPCRAGRFVAWLLCCLIAAVTTCKPLCQENKPSSAPMRHQRRLLVKTQHFGRLPCALPGLVVVIVCAVLGKTSSSFRGISKISAQVILGGMPRQLPQAQICTAQEHLRFRELDLPALWHAIPALERFLRVCRRARLFCRPRMS